VSYIRTFLEQGFGIPYERSTTSLKITKRVRWQGPVHVRDFEYVKPRTKRLYKATLVGPCRVHWQAGRNNISRDVYPDIELFWDDLVEATRNEIRALAEAGCRSVQIDDTTLAMFGDQATRDQLAARGEDWKLLIPKYIEVLNRVAADPPEGMTIALHMCRGNSMHHPAGHVRAAGGYDDVAERMFNELDINIFFLEYDSPRAGDFTPLRHLPRHKSVVLGLVSTKTPDVESLDGLQRRIDEAATHCDLSQLAISPQCGFSSGFRGHPLTHEQQRAKLARVVETARKVWGEA
jgi:5-methyltetrahydropteroyltriglutamate--homocysteine methyltransferase